MSKPNRKPVSGAPPKFQQRHYNELARILFAWGNAYDNWLAGVAYDTLITHFSAELAKDNPRFNVEKFHKACGIPW